MADKPFRIVWICQECGTEYASRIADKYTWHSWADTTCPNGHSHNVVASIQTPEQAWEAVQAWFEYHDRFDIRIDLIEAWALAVGVSRGLAYEAMTADWSQRLEYDGGFDEIRDSSPKWLIGLRFSDEFSRVYDLVKSGIQSFGSDENLLIADLSDAEGKGRNWWAGSAAGFKRAIDRRLETLPYNVREARHLASENASPLLREVESFGKVAQTLDYRWDDFRAIFDAEMKLPQEQDDTRSPETTKRMSERRNPSVDLDLMELGVKLLAGGALIVLILLRNNYGVLFEWLSSIEPAPQSIFDAWSQRPEEIAIALEVVAAIVSISLIVVFVVLVQVPLLYFLAGLGFLLSFVVYKAIWMLITGLVTIAVGFVVWQYWLEREYG